jgi:predicted acetyltransferase
VGRARILTVGIGSVATDGHHRKRGFLRQTANATLDALRGSDYAVSLLFGIPNFYEQFGYRRAWAFSNATIEADQISTEAIPRKLERSDDPKETIDSGDIRLRGQATFLVPVLFPNEYPALSFWDRF